MKKTEKMALNLLEISDPLSAAPLNENTSMLDAAVSANTEAVEEHGEAITSHGETLESHGDTLSSHSEDISNLKTAADKIPGKAMMACGTYIGTGGDSVSISTTGFEARVLIVRKLSGAPVGSEKVSADRITYQSGDAECIGFTMWAGEDLNTKFWFEDGTIRAYNETTGSWEEVQAYSSAAGSVEFTAENGTLTWALKNTMGRTVYNPGANVNNVEGVEYEWLAIGKAVS